MKKFVCYCRSNHLFSSEVFKTERAVVTTELSSLEEIAKSSETLFSFIYIGDSELLDQVLNTISRVKNAMPFYIIVVVLESWDLEVAAKIFEAGADAVCPLEQVLEVGPYLMKSLVRTIEAADSFSKVAAQNLSFGNLRLDLSARAVFINDLSVDLSGREFLILKLLIENKGKVVPSELMIKSVWRDVAISSGNLYSQIYNLKRKLQGFNGKISTVHRIGLKITV